MREPLFRGSATALITPMQKGEVDVASLRRLVQLQLEGGTAALVACGTTGEPATLTPDERKLVVRTTVEAAAGRIPVICGTGSNCTQTVIDTERCYRDLGCAAQLVVTPYYNKTTQEGLYAHFMHIAEHTQLPIILYNVPGRTNLDLSPEIIRRLAETDRFIGLKESSYDLPRIMEKISAMDGRMSLYSGNDDMVYPLLALGAEGVISVVSNLLPQYMSDMVQAWFDGNARQSRRMQLESLPLVRALFAEVSPIPCKYAMELLGLCSAEVRLPLVGASEATQVQLQTALKNLNLIGNRTEEH